uniref:Adhesin domain-containing protein n=1 Tax=Podospora anserina (strain S / ATCC MYA-4624 / DSM 980 / FGSC 10383) TaxID=515849 RepID=A0A090D673_PODAN|nr:Putative protein of unknown function [Podospora anserina S mat+]
MPFSDNLYSAVDDESDFEPIDDIPSQQGRELSQSAHRPPQFGHARASTHDDDDEGLDADALSPVDGYFGSSNDTSSDTSAVATSSIVPHVPNVWVEDPSLTTAASKAREAELERRVSGVAREDYSVGGLTSSGYNSSAYTGSSRAHGYSGSFSRPGTYAQSSSPSSSSAGPSVLSTRSYTPYQHRAAYQGESSRLVPQDAPPAYTPSPTSPQSLQGGHDASRNYSTFSAPTGTMGRLRETQGLLGHEPESMRDSGNGGSGEDSPRWRERIENRISSFDRSYCKFAFLVVGLVLLSTGFLTTLINSVRDERPHLHPPPKMTYPDLDNKLPWQDGSSCGTDRITRDPESFDVLFSSDKPLTIIQNNSHNNDHHSYKPIQIHGSVIFRQTDADHPDPKLVVETTVNNDLIAAAITWEETSQKLVVTIPNVLISDDTNDQTTPWPCIHLTATVWTPPSSSLLTLSVKTTVLSILLVDNLSLSIAESTSLSSTVGSIVSDTAGSGSQSLTLSPSFKFISPLIETNTTSAPISGSWPLYNYLSFESTAGNIKVTILPQPDLDPSHPKPAILNVKSSSGTVELTEPIDAAKEAYELAQVLAAEGAGYLLAGKAGEVTPVRDYRVDVHTTSGKIKAKLAVTDGARFRSTSGGMDIDVLLVLDGGVYNPEGRKVDLETSSTSGNVGVRVGEVMWVGRDKENKLDVVRGRHGSTSGNVRVNYPKSWEGEVSLGTLSGKLKIGGEGVRVVRGGEGGWPGVRKNLVARKGEGEGGSKVEGRSTSGDVWVWIGDL